MDEKNNLDIESDEWLAEANAELVAKQKRCPQCAAPGLMQLRREYQATGGSLAGMQMKASMRRILVAECSGCSTKFHVSEDR